MWLEASRALIAYQTHKTVQEFPDPSFRVLVMQYMFHTVSLKNTGRPE